MCSTNSYSFPYTPYHIQTQLMNSIYGVIENGKIGLLESPTGTGKSLSIICSSISWLRDHNKRTVTQLNEQLTQLNEQIKDIEKQTEMSSDWISLQSEKTALCHKRDNLVKSLSVYEVYNKRNDSLKSKKLRSINRKQFVSRKPQQKRLKTDTDLVSSETDTEIEDIVVDYCSDDDAIDAKKDCEEEEDLVSPKIIYCSRTHSQLSQFISEIKKTSFSRCDTPLRLVSLGSRNSLCINASVVKLNNNNLINDKCIELQNSKHKCEMRKQVLMKEFSDDVLSEVHDIEELVKAGKLLKSCPYYSTRLAIPEAELIILPYNVLLHSGTRKSYGIPLKNNIVIIDEAHNLLETINNIHCIEIKGSDIIDTHKQLNNYLQKYYSRLNPKNLMYIKQIIFILKEFIKHLKSDNTDKLSSSVYERLNFLIKLGIENFNLIKIIEYCDKSQIARKLHGFSEKQQKNQINLETKPEPKIKTGTNAFLSKLKGKESRSPVNSDVINSNLNENDNETEPKGSALYIIKEFLHALVNPMASGRILVNKDNISIRKSSIKYVLLNPGAHFKEIVEECRAVILAGGTMHPISQYIDHLFTPLGVLKEKIHTFSCGHVIPDSNLLTLALGVGPNGAALNYTYQNRNNKVLIEETGRTISNICNIICGGVVCFFSSYDYEELLFGFWSKSGILKNIESKGKRVFREPKKANEVQSTLAEYSRCVRASSKGALLFCVIGGKMSEGINFSDDLGRCVIVVGLPYPNKSSVELQEKMKYLDNLSKDSGKLYYENLCMTAVNQSIGRAIRHKNDYATIILLDDRYTKNQNIKDSLPKWIQSRLVCVNQFSQAFSNVRKFFSNFNNKIET